MNKILIKNGNILIDTLNDIVFHGDILIENGRIIKIDSDIDEDVKQIIDAGNNYVSAGFIDCHVHCYPTGVYGMLPDQVGVDRFSSTIIDAGTTGSETYEDFKVNYIDKAKTKVFTLLNLSKKGLELPNELDSLDKLDFDGVRKLVKKYPDNIVGLKARASKSVVGNLDILPIKLTVDLAHELNIPIMVHIGNYPPTLSEVIDLLNNGDVITHTFHGKKNGLIQNDQIIDSAIRAKQKGVYFDIGHGQESFNFNIFKQAYKQGFYADNISSDLHKGDYDGPVYSLLECVNKVINLGESLTHAIDKVTRKTAEIFSLKDLGEIKRGYIADIFIFSFDDCNQEVKDSMNNLLILTKRINPIKLIVSKNNESYVIDNNL